MNKDKFYADWFKKLEAMKFYGVKAKTGKEIYYVLARSLKAAAKKSLSGNIRRPFWIGLMDRDGLETSETAWTKITDLLK